MKCLVTGAAGFIGSTLIEALLDRGDEVVGVDVLTDYYDPALKRRNLADLAGRPGFRPVEADLCVVNLVELLAGVELVFHEAAQAGVRASWGESFHHYTRNNVLASQRLFEAAVRSGVRRVVYASSSSVYGDSETRPTSEDVPLRPISPYGVTKAAVENLAYLYRRNHGLDAVGLRYFTVFGPRQRPDMAFHRFIRAAVEGRPVKVFGDGRQRRDFTFVGDIVAATLAAGDHERPEMIYNVGGGSTVTLREAITAIGEVAGREVRVDYQDTVKGDVRHTSADLSRARSHLGYAPVTSLREGLAAEAAWIARMSAEGVIRSAED